MCDWDQRWPRLIKAFRIFGAVARNRCVRSAAAVSKLCQQCQSGAAVSQSCQQCQTRVRVVSAVSERYQRVRAVSAVSGRCQRCQNGVRWSPQCRGGHSPEDSGSRKEIISRSLGVPRCAAADMLTVSNTMVPVSRAGKGSDRGQPGTTGESDRAQRDTAGSHTAGESNSGV